MIVILTFKKLSRLILSSILIPALLAPLIGVYLSLVVGYFFFSHGLGVWSGKLAILIGLSIFLSAGIFHLFQIPVVAEELGNYAYLFFSLGVTQELFYFIWQNKRSSSQKEAILWGMNNL